MAYNKPVGKPNRYKDYNRPKIYTFYNQGNTYTFNPYKSVSYYGNLITMLELHKQEARNRNRKDVFILTETGDVVPLD